MDIPMDSVELVAGPHRGPNLLKAATVEGLYNSYDFFIPQLRKLCVYVSRRALMLRVTEYKSYHGTTDFIGYAESVVVGIDEGRASGRMLEAYHQLGKWYNLIQLPRVKPEPWMLPVKPRSEPLMTRYKSDVSSYAGWLYKLLKIHYDNGRYLNPILASPIPWKFLNPSS